METDNTIQHNKCDLIYSVLYYTFWNATNIATIIMVYTDDSCSNHQNTLIEPRLFLKIAGFVTIGISILLLMDELKSIRILSVLTPFLILFWQLIWSIIGLIIYSQINGTQCKHSRIGQILLAWSIIYAFFSLICVCPIVAHYASYKNKSDKNYKRLNDSGISVDDNMNAIDYEQYIVNNNNVTEEKDVYDELILLIGDHNKNDISQTMANVNNRKNINEICYYLLHNEGIRDSECGTNLEFCAALKRMTNIFTEYNLYKISNNKTLIEQTRYSIMSLIRDFNHLIYAHDDDYQFSLIYNTMKWINKCETTNCEILKRNNRDRSNMNDLKKRSKTFYGNSDSKNVSIIQQLDKIHCYFAHCYDIGMRLTLKEKLTILYDNNLNDTQNNIENDENSVEQNNKLVQQIKMINNKKIKLGNIRGSRIKFNKFQTIFNDNNDNGEEMKESKENDNETYTVPMISGYSFGYIYYYDSDDEYNEDEGNLLEGNPGYKFNDFYIKPKYENLKIELLTNPIHVIDKHQFNDLYERAQQNFLYSEQTNFIGIGTKWKVIEDESFDIEFKLEHIMVIMLYCNFDSLQYELSKTYRKIPDNEDISMMKKRHSNFGNFGKYLKEIKYFGTYSNYESKLNHFWHGIGDKLLFPKIFAAFKGPTSTSDKIEVCAIFAANNGMLIKLQSGDGYTYSEYSRYFDCKWISDFGNESEKFFIAQNNRTALEFSQIIFTSNGEDFGEYMAGMAVIALIFDGAFTCNPDRVNAEKLVMDFIENELSIYLPKQYRKSVTIPIFIQQMIDKFFISIDEFSNLQWYQYINYEGDVEKILSVARIINKYFVYKLSKTNCKWFKLDLLFLIMPNIKKLTLDFKTDDNVPLNDEIVDEILLFITKLSSECKLKHIVFCEGEHNKYWDLEKMELFNQRLKQRNVSAKMVNNYKIMKSDWVNAENYFGIELV